MNSASLPRVELLGVPIDPVTPEQATHTMLRFLNEPIQRHVATPNNEMLVAAVRNSAFRNVLCSTALNLPDSTGLLFAARYTRQRLPVRATGIDTVALLCRSLPSQHPVFFLGAASGIAERAAALLQRQNSNLRIAGTFSGSPNAEDADAIIARINASGARLLLVAYGAPAQDLWIAEHLQKMPNVRVAIGVGGTFDFLAGTVRRAPQVFRSLGLEWIWRLLIQPWRIKRIITAAVVFPLFVLRYGRNIPV